MNSTFKCCLEQQTPVEIIYLAANGHITQRTILIKGINGHTVRARCLLRNQERTFKLNHILAARMVKGRRTESA
ncbi:WYL domain-containing protein [Ectobacillus ponti]|uniref:WYL domain-containing protein n=1 Tax=Ectobacillus ponti TaxID=2961894 RepID=A0AA42BR38_9BACI|nr:WYL domain-containing protein [Ectobacillus ponti]MCP8970016.1 WYL domain-containing protein [Ectobacillus ponti]